VRTLFLALPLVLMTSVSWAQPKTDVVALPNGDRITGEVKKLSRGRLEFSTDDAGTMQIEWDKVFWLQAARQFEIITTDGRLLFGELKRGADRFLVVSGPDGDVSLATLEVTSIVPIGASFWKKLDGSVDAGFNYTRSSGIATTTFNAETSFRREASTFTLSGSATLTKREDDVEDDDRGFVDLSYLRFRSPHWVFITAGRFETNESLGLSLRSQLGGTVGLRLVNSNRAQFGIGSGLVVNDEQGIDAAATQNVEGLVDVRGSFYTYDRPKTEISGMFQYYPSLSNWGRQRLQVDASVRREVFKDFFVSVNVFDTFDSEPPNPEAAINDWGVVVSLGLTY
jgi:hypothetical protein